MNGHQLKQDLGKDLLLGAVRRKRRMRGILRSAPLLMMLSIGLVWFSGDRNESNSVPLVEGESTDPRETRIIESDEELLDLLEEFGPVLAKREDGTQVLVLTGAQP